MTEPDAPVTGMADVAAEPPEDSVERERDALGGDQPDTGGLVPEDDAQ